MLHGEDIVFLGRQGRELVSIGQLAQFVSRKQLSCWGSFSPLICG